MKYFFVLGNNPALSVAEIAAVLPTARLFLINSQVLGAETVEMIDAPALIKRLGGTIKIGQLEEEAADFPDKRQKAAIKVLEKALAEHQAGKFYFGLSYYGSAKARLKNLALELKKIATGGGQSVRWVDSKEDQLSSVVVTQNKLIEKGAEIVFAADEQKRRVLIGRTLAVQPFKDLSYRDYGRPARDDRSGMLPPKLAQIMLNLALGDKDLKKIKISDPFCGSGTVLGEALLMGARQVYGSDISAKAIADTKTNLEWLSEHYNDMKGVDFNAEIAVVSATQLSGFLKPESMDAVVTEPYLGPQRGQRDLSALAKELDQLYSQSLKEIFKVLKPGSRVAMVWPAFISKSGEKINFTHLHPDLGKFKVIDPLPENLMADRRLHLTNRQTILYGRAEQVVWREVVVLSV
jgi:tRNA G10  N-methylase Trm11